MEIEALHQGMIPKLTKCFMEKTHSAQVLLLMRLNNLYHIKENELNGNVSGCGWLTKRLDLTCLGWVRSGRRGDIEFTSHELQTPHPT